MTALNGSSVSVFDGTMHMQTTWSELNSTFNRAGFEFSALFPLKPFMNIYISTTCRFQSYFHII